MSHKLIVLRNKIKQLECENKLLKSQIKDYISSTTSFDVISSTTSFDVISSQSSDNIDLSHNSYLIHENNKLQEEIKKLKIHNKYIDFNIPDIKLNSKLITNMPPDTFNIIKTYIDTITIEEKNHIFILLCQYNNSIISKTYVDALNCIITMGDQSNHLYLMCININLNKYNVLDMSSYYDTINIKFILEFMLICYYIDINHYPPHTLLSETNMLTNKSTTNNHIPHIISQFYNESGKFSPEQRRNLVTRAPDVGQLLCNCMLYMLYDIEESYIEQNKLNLEKIIKKHLTNPHYDAFNKK